MSQEPLTVSKAETVDGSFSFGKTRFADFIQLRLLASL